MIEKMNKPLLDDLGREWAGDPDVQKIVTQSIVDFMNKYKVHPIDMVGACGTVIMNLTADWSASQEEAREALKAAYEDMADSLRGRYANRTKQ